MQLCFDWRIIFLRAAGLDTFLDRETLETIFHFPNNDGSYGEEQRSFLAMQGARRPIVFLAFPLYLWLDEGSATPAARSPTGWCSLGHETYGAAAGTTCWAASGLAP